MMQSLPPLEDPRWDDLALGVLARPWKMLAVKVMMTWAARSTKLNPAPQNVRLQAEVIRAFFEKNRVAAREDIVAIFGGAYDDGGGHG